MIVPSLTVALAEAEALPLTESEAAEVTQCLCDALNGRTRVQRRRTTIREMLDEFRSLPDPR